MTKFILVKDDLTLETTDIKLVKEFRKLGWKIKVSNFGELI